ncbi:MAG: iron chelate uptake ABC transporter family permease subunit, partial [Pseudomonadota bacterium]
MTYRRLIAVLAALVAVLFCASLLIGPAAIGLGNSIIALLGLGGDLGDGLGSSAEARVLVMQEIRLPRAILGLTIGASLGLSGAALQGYLRNPLAEPGLIGVSASAALGAVLAIYTGLSAAFPLALPLSALGAAVIAVLLLLALAGRGADTLTLILAGVALTALAGALTSLALNLSPNPFAALEIVFWLLGALTDRSMIHVWLAV